MIKSTFIALMALCVVSSVSTAQGVNPGAVRAANPGNIMPVESMGRSPDATVKHGYTGKNKTRKYSNTVHSRQSGTKTLKHSVANLNPVQ